MFPYGGFLSVNEKTLGLGRAHALGILTPYPQPTQHIPAVMCNERHAFASIHQVNESSLLSRYPALCSFDFNGQKTAVTQLADYVTTPRPAKPNKPAPDTHGPCVLTLCPKHVRMRSERSQHLV